VERPRVIVKKKAIIKNESYPNEIRYDENTLKLFKRLRAKKSELLRKLRIGDKPARLNAIIELSCFSFDDKVRQALEEVLLSEPDSELRKEAIKAFSNVKNKRALSLLEKVRVEDSDKEVRAEADHAIREINKS
jgi:HEAT repeat protein